MQKISPKKSLPLPKNRQEAEMISLSYDVIAHVYSKSKSIQLYTDLANIKLYGI